MEKWDWKGIGIGNMGLIRTEEARTSFISLDFSVLRALRAWDLGLDCEMCVGSSIAVLDRGGQTPH
jgi:hypothetical protein